MKIAFSQRKLLIAVITIVKKMTGRSSIMAHELHSQAVERRCY